MGNRRLNCWHLETELWVFRHALNGGHSESVMSHPKRIHMLPHDSHEVMCMHCHMGSLRLQCIVGHTMLHGIQ